MVELTDREKQVLGLIVQGLTNKSIAECLHFTEHAAGFHVANIKKKLGAANRIQIAVMAVREGLV